jgi:hypothetical protein
MFSGKCALIPLLAVCNDIDEFKPFIRIRCGKYPVLPLSRDLKIVTSSLAKSCGGPP